MNKRVFFTALVVWAAAFVLGFALCSIWLVPEPPAVQPLNRQADFPGPAKTAPSVVTPAETQTTPALAGPSQTADVAQKPSGLPVTDVLVSRLCSSIYTGDFAQAAQQLKALDSAGSKAVTRLSMVLQEYQAIQKQSELARQQAYKEEMDRLAEFRTAADVNDIAAVLSAIDNLQEFADEKQKKELLQDAFVKQLIEKAIEKAVEYEAEHRWLDAYISCYFWLKQLDEENKTWSDYAGRLYDKAIIKASLEDSPCETWRQRYEGVTKSMFTRTIKWLDLYHVEVIDYSDMASKALQRCRFLGEVLSLTKALESDFPRPDSTGLLIWSVGLQTIRSGLEDSPTSFGRDKFIAVFEDVLALNNIAIKLPEAVLIAQFAEAALAAIDHYTNLVWPYQTPDFEKNLTKEFTGIGIEISKADGPLKVASLLPDTPAYTSGLDAGDVIEAIDNVSTDDMSLHCAVRKITGPKGTDVTLTVQHIGVDQSEDITITRDRIIVPTVRGWQRLKRGNWRYIIDEQSNIGYIYITDFVEKTSADFEKTLTELESKGLAGLVLDLRSNQGGYLKSGVEVADKFVRRGPIVSTRTRFGLDRLEKANKAGTHPDYPLAVLINENSASASEIVAGALQDPLHRRAVLVGARTFGKGSVQTINTYPKGGAQLKYTMAYYHLPSGQRVAGKYVMEKAGKKDWGIAPDVEVKLRSDERRKMQAVQKDNSVLVKAGHNSQAAPVTRHTIEQTLEADHQLAVALLLVKTKLVEAKTLATLIH